jgi:hypothetical protein
VKKNSHEELKAVIIAIVSRFLHATIRRQNETLD